MENNKKRSRKDATCVSKRHLKRLATQESKIVYDALLSTAASNSCNLEYKCVEDVENVSPINSNVLNIQAAENAGENTAENSKETKNSIFHEWNENNDTLNMLQSPVSDSCESKTCYENTDVTENFKNNLANWAVQHQISHTALRALLQRLRHHSCFSSLPLDARSLLKLQKTRDAYSYARNIPSFWITKIYIEYINFYKEEC